MISTIILAEANDAARELWGREIETAVAKLRRTYTYNHAHDVTSVATILKELAGANAVRNMMEAPVPDEPTHRAAVVDKVIPHVQRLVFDSDTKDDTAASATMGYRSESSEETACPDDQGRGTKRKSRRLPTTRANSAGSGRGVITIHRLTRSSVFETRGGKGSTPTTVARRWI